MTTASLALAGALGYSKPEPPATTQWWGVTIYCRDRKWRDGIMDDRPPFSFSFKVHAPNAEAAIKDAWKEFSEKIGSTAAHKYEVERVEREYI